MIDKLLYLVCYTFIIIICIFEIIDKSLKTYLIKMDFLENLIWYVTGFIMYFLYFFNSILYYFYRHKKLKSVEKKILLIVMIIQLIFSIYQYTTQIYEILVQYKIF